jgi:catalase
VFELSKVERVDIRARAVSHLRNIDEDLAATVANGLGLDLPDAAKAAKPTLDLPTSSALSIVANGPANFAGRKMGLLLTDGSSAELFNALTKALEAEGAVWEVVAPKIGGVTLDDGTKVAAKQKIDGGPSVLFDAVAVLPSEEGCDARQGCGLQGLRGGRVRPLQVHRLHRCSRHVARRCPGAGA